jgi:protein SCO1/2
MKDRGKIVMIYSGVAVVSALIIGLATHLGNTMPKQQEPVVVTGDFADVGSDTSKNFRPIEKDLAGVNQAGEHVKLSDLKGQVFVVTEFFAVCPKCAVRNGDQIGEIQTTFKDHPDFHIVSISVDPKMDDGERLVDYATAVNAETDHWWFLNTGEEKATHDYLEKNLGFFSIRERTDPNDIETNGRFAHDMGIMLVDRNFNVVGKWPLEDARSEEGKKRDPELYEKLKKDLYARIRSELDKTETVKR